MTMHPSAHPTHEAHLLRTGAQQTPRLASFSKELLANQFDSKGIGVSTAEDFGLFDPYRSGSAW